MQRHFRALFGGVWILGHFLSFATESPLSALQCLRFQDSPPVVPCIAPGTFAVMNNDEGDEAKGTPKQVFSTRFEFSLPKSVRVADYRCSDVTCALYSVLSAPCTVCAMRVAVCMARIDDIAQCAVCRGQCAGGNAQSTGCTVKGGGLFKFYTPTGCENFQESGGGGGGGGGMVGLPVGRGIPKGGRGSVGTPTPQYLKMIPMRRWSF